MKKFLIGIATLLAAVMLTSPAFGALSNVGYEVPDVGLFYFDDNIDVGSIESFKVDPPPSDGNVLTQLKVQWPSLDITFSSIDETVTGNSAMYPSFFSPAVQIVVAKWGGNQNELETSYAFLLDGYTHGFGWDLSDLDKDFSMSNVRGYNAVPVPAAVWLLGSGVLGLVAIRRRRS